MQFEQDVSQYQLQTLEFLFIFLLLFNIPFIYYFLKFEEKRMELLALYAVPVAVYFGMGVIMSMLLPDLI